MNDSLAYLNAAGVSFAVTSAFFYVWYAFTLSKVFTQLGGNPAKAWAPIANEAEILRLSGLPAWHVVFLFVPVYGLYVKATAVHRINAHYGRGVGATVLAILLPPVWSTLLSSGSGTPDPALQERIATSLEPRGGYAFPVSTPSTPAPGAVPPPLVAPPVPPSLVNPAAPQAAPVVPPPLLSPSVPVAPPAPPVAPPAPPVAPPVPPTAAPAAPVAPPVPPPAPEPPVVAAPPVGLLPPPPAVVTPPPTTETPVAPAQPWAPADQPAPASAVPSATPDATPAEEVDDDLDRTVVVDRRPVVPWRLIVEGGPTFRLTGTTAVLGRRPAGAGGGAQEIAVPDPTRTLSKVHARLDLADGVWTVTDLNATNGVIVTRPDGTEDLLDPGASQAISGRFVLGKVGMSLSFGEGDTTS